MDGKGPSRKGIAKKNQDIRRLKIAKLLKRGVASLAELSLLVGSDEGTICRDIQSITEDWAVLDAQAVGECRMRMVAEVHEVKRAAWEEWERSREQAVRSKAAKRTGAGADGTGESTMTERTVEERLGDPRYLETVLHCIEREARLRGVDAPQRLEVTGLLVVAEAVVDGRGDIPLVRELIERGGYVGVADLPAAEPDAGTAQLSAAEAEAVAR